MKCSSNSARLTNGNSAHHNEGHGDCCRQPLYDEMLYSHSHHGHRFHQTMFAKHCLPPQILSAWPERMPPTYLHNWRNRLLNAVLELENIVQDGKSWASSVKMVESPFSSPAQHRAGKESCMSNPHEACSICTVANLCKYTYQQICWHQDHWVSQVIVADTLICMMLPRWTVLFLNVHLQAMH